MRGALGKECAGLLSSSNVSSPLFLHLSQVQISAFISLALSYGCFLLFSALYFLFFDSLFLASLRVFFFSFSL